MATWSGVPLMISARYGAVRPGPKQDVFVWVFGAFLSIFRFCNINEARLVHTIFNCIFDFGPPGTHLQKSQENYYMSAGFAGRHVVGFWDLSIDVFLEVQNQRYS